MGVVPVSEALSLIFGDCLFSVYVSIPNSAPSVLNQTFFIFFLKRKTNIEKTKIIETITVVILAAGQGLGPRYLGPKPSVLPLDDPANTKGTSILRDVPYTIYHNQGESCDGMAVPP